MKVCLAGHGAFGIKHLEAMAKIPGIDGRLGRVRTSIRARSGAAVEDSALDWDFGGEPGTARPRCGDPDHADANACRTGRAMHARGQARDDRDSHGRLARRTPSGWCGCSRKPAWSPWRDTRAASIPATSGFTSASWPANSRYCRWTCRRISSGAPTPMPSASRAVGPIICCGTTPAIPSICLPTRPGRGAAAFALQGPKHPCSASPWT